MKFPLCCSILLACRFISYGFSLTESENQNLTSYFLDGPIGKDSDVFRQLLNQETLIRMSLVKNVHSLMQDMVSLKKDMITLKDSMDTLKEDMISVETTMGKLIDHDIGALKNEVERLEREGQRFNSGVKTEFATVNETFDNIFTNISQLKDDHTKFENNFEQKRQNFEQNISGLLGDIKIEVRYLSVTLLNLNEHTDEMDKNLPKLLEETNRSIVSWVNATVDRINDDLAETNSRQIKLLSSVNDLEMSKENITTLVTDNFVDVNRTIHVLGKRIDKNVQDQSKLSTTVTSLELLHLKKRVAFTAGITSYSTDWSSSTLVFPSVLYEIGGGYNSNTGIFTSPVEGHFVFYIAIQSYHEKTIYFDIVMNDKQQVRTMAYDPNSGDAYQAASNMVILHLQKGYKVWVKRYSGSGYYSTNVPILTFSGFRLY